MVVPAIRDHIDVQQLSLYHTIPAIKTVHNNMYRTSILPAYYDITSQLGSYSSNAKPPLSNGTCTIQPLPMSQASMLPRQYYKYSTSTASTAENPTFCWCYYKPLSHSCTHTHTTPPRPGLLRSGCAPFLPINDFFAFYITSCHIYVRIRPVLLVVALLYTLYVSKVSSYR